MLFPSGLLTLLEKCHESSPSLTTPTDLTAIKNFIPKKLKKNYKRIELKQYVDKL